MEKGIRETKKLRLFVAEPVLDNGTPKYQVFRKYVDLETRETRKIGLPYIFECITEAEACAQKLNEEFKNEENLLNSLI